jgi:hypothetical protein
MKDLFKCAEKAKETAINTIQIAERALAENTSLKKIVIMEQMPRRDSPLLALLAELVNMQLRHLATKSTRQHQMVVFRPELLYSVGMEELFGRGFHSDGIHLKGPAGKYMYNASLVEAIKASGISF